MSQQEKCLVLVVACALTRCYWKPLLTWREKVLLAARFRVNSSQLDSWSWLSKNRSGTPSFCVYTYWQNTGTSTLRWRERELQLPLAEHHQVQTSLWSSSKSVEKCQNWGCIIGCPKNSDIFQVVSKVNSQRCTWAKPCQERVALWKLTSWHCTGRVTIHVSSQEWAA